MRREGTEVADRKVERMLQTSTDDEVRVLYNELLLALA
jgi:hypothetical protein